MGETTMLELLEKVSDKVKDYWVKDENGSFHMDDKKMDIYGEEIVKLMKKAFSGAEMKYTGKDIASEIGVSSSTFSRFKTADTNIKPENLELLMTPILKSLSTEGNLADDEMKKRVGELLFRISRREEVKGITEYFKMPPEINVDALVQRYDSVYCHELQVEDIFGNPEQTQDISYEDYFVDGEIMEEEMGYYIDGDMIKEKMGYHIGGDILFNKYRTEDNSERYVAIFDVKWINRKFLYQRIRCLKRKDNVFAVLMVEKGECCDDIDFYRDEYSNIMLIEYETVWEENAENCSYNYLSGNCLAWYDEKCKAFMTEGIDKIFDSHK